MEKLIKMRRHMDDEEESSPKGKARQELSSQWCSWLNFRRRLMTTGLCLGQSHFGEFSKKSKK
jgi:hypothetical protein